MALSSVTDPVQLGMSSLFLSVLVEEWSEGEPWCRASPSSPSGEGKPASEIRFLKGWRGLSGTARWPRLFQVLSLTSGL